MPAKKKRVLVTSALPYVNNVPHLGNLIGSVLSADAYARFARLDGNEVLFVLGTDEYGTTAEAKAMEEGITPRQLVDKYFKIHKNIYDWFETSYDCLGRTTSPENAKIAQHIFLKMHENGYILEKTEQQLYSEKIGRFLSDRFVEGECPFCHSPGARGDQCDKCGKLIDQKDLISPKSKIDGSSLMLRNTKHLYVDLAKLEPELRAWMNKVDKNWSAQAKTITEQWMKAGLKERAITRDLEWGIPVPLPGWEKKVFYSWFDAPIGYVGITSECLGEKWKDWWMQAEAKDLTLYQFMGKDNTVFHSIMFPGYLIGTKENWKLVDYLAITAFLNYEGDKFSKSKGVGVFGNDAMHSGIVADVWRYYLFRIRPESDDTDFSWSDFEAKVNNEVVGNFGNFVNRIAALSEKFSDTKRSAGKSTVLIDSIKPLFEEYRKLMSAAELKDALMKANEISTVGNKYLQDNAPWTKAKTDLLAANGIIAECIDLVKVLACVYYPFMPVACEKVWKMVGEKKKISETGFVAAFKGVKEGTPIEKQGLLFEKLDPKKIAELKEKFAGKKDEEPKKDEKNKVPLKKP
ncbi:MAG: methionine--tRNA ligase [archaeon]